MATHEQLGAPARPAAALAVPALLIGLGEFGAKVAERLLAEHRAGRNETAPDDAELQILVARSSIDIPALVDAALLEIRAALAHRRLVALRDAAASEDQTRLHVLVFGQLGEAEVRASLWPLLAALQARLLAELGPIFESFRAGKQRRGVILPLLAMPHPPSDPAGSAIRTCVRELVAALAGTPIRARAVPQVYLIEDVAEFSVLSASELEQCVRNFASLLLHIDPQGEAGELVDRLLHGTQLDEPLATFVCAVAELPRTKLAAYGCDRVVIELLDALLRGDGALLYEANLRLRCASRVILRLGRFRARTLPQLVEACAALPWERYLRGAAVTARVTCHRSRLYHSGAVAERQPVSSTHADSVETQTWCVGWQVCGEVVSGAMSKQSSSTLQYAGSGTVQPLLNSARAKSPNRMRTPTAPSPFAKEAVIASW